MPSLTVRDIPEEVYERLRRRADRHHRSMNGEVLSILERELRSQRVSAEEIMARARKLQEEIHGPPLTDDFLDQAKRTGRP